MKRIILVFLALLILGGCQAKKELPTVTVFNENWEEVELPLITIVADEYCWESTNLNTFVKSVPGYDREFHAEVIMLGNEPERSQYLENMRVELMAGKGPDLFLCDCLYGNIFGATADQGDGPMFNFPQQLMANNVFLPLDEYLENAQYMEPDKLLPVLMELGRGDKGQMIIPLQYDFCVTAVPEEQYTEPAQRSRRGLIESGNAYLEYAGRGGAGFAMLLDSFGSGADYAAEELTFTQEELLEAALDFQTCWQQWNQGYYEEKAPEVTENFFSNLAPQNSEQAIRYVPTYNRDGGVTAFVTNYAAINSNANYPEYAFRVLDMLAGKQQMKEPFLYGWSIGMTTHSDFGDTEQFGQFGMSEERMAQYRELRDNITAAKFLTALDREAYLGIYPVCKQEGATREDMEKAVGESYRTMKMMLAES